jgi:predicted dehydrogenase
MANLRFAMLGTGFWAWYQLPGWIEAGGVECVALYNRTVAKAEKLNEAFGGKMRVYGDAQELLDNEELDFIDICTAVELHKDMTLMGAARGLDVVCQKPMAVNLEEAAEMVKACNDAGVKLLINENFRWQHPMRQLKAKLDSGRIGKPFRARVHFASSFPVFDNQPFLKELEQFMLTDVGSHILDTSRFLFGEASTLYTQIKRIHPDIKGEDVATCMMTMGDDVTVLCEMSYASRTGIERFPETFIYIEGDKGYLELGPDYWIRETTEEGTLSQRFPPPRYAWADPAYDLVHASIVPCQENLAQGLAGTLQAENTGEDNFKTMQLVFGAYESAATGKAIAFD